MFLGEQEEEKYRALYQGGIELSQNLVSKHSDWWWKQKLAHVFKSFISEFSLNVENQDTFLTGYTLVLLIYIIIIIL